MIRIGKRINHWFDESQGGMLVKDSLGLIEKASLEVRLPTDPGPFHSQSLHEKAPELSSDSNWVRSKGHLFSVKRGKIPVSYDILTEINDLDLEIRFKLLFEEDIENVTLVKIWFTLKALKAIVDGEHLPLFTDSDRWITAYEGKAKDMTFIDLNGNSLHLSKHSSEYADERIAKHKIHSEYILRFIKNAPLIEKGHQFTGSLRLKYILGGSPF